ncbi:hypothetical protein JCM16358_23080 [Halanaerocella petrolearia]
MPVTSDRNTPRRSGEFLVLTPAADTTIYAGTMTAINTSGEAVPASDSVDLKVVGRSEDYSSEGEDVKVRKGVFGYENDGSISKSDIGDDCYIVDAITVGLVGSVTNDIKAGNIFDVESNKVWVKID